MFRARQATHLSVKGSSKSGGGNGNKANLNLSRMNRRRRQNWANASFTSLASIGAASILDLSETEPRLTQQTLRQRILNRIKPFAPYVAFLIYCTCGTFLFHYVEGATARNYDHRAKNYEKCVGGVEIWRAAFYVVSACSTIGFGNLYACTTATRIISIFYNIMGIPLILIILADIGNRICHLIERIYIPLYWRCHRRVVRQLSHVLSSDDYTEKATNNNEQGKQEAQVVTNSVLPK